MLKFIYFIAVLVFFILKLPFVIVSGIMVIIINTINDIELLVVGNRFEKRLFSRNLHKDKL